MKATAVSRIKRRLSPIRIKIAALKFLVTAGDLIKVINRCPATILAASRTESVKGRIILLVNSIKTIKGIKI
jgi:hypothetical protein